MQRTTGLLDLAARAVCRAVASWQELTTTPVVAGPPTPTDRRRHAEAERRAA